MAMLKRMEKLNLLTLDAGGSTGLGSRYASGADENATARQRVTFDPARITERAQQVAGEEMEVAITSDLELIELADLEALVGITKPMLLSKLSRSEIADDVFAFRKARVLHYIEQKGVNYFSKSVNRSLSDLSSLADLEWVDSRTLFEAVSAVDTYDLAKLLTAIEDPVISERLLSVMAEVRKREISWVMRRDLKIDPLELQDIEHRFIERIKALKAGSTTVLESPAGTPP